MVWGEGFSSWFVGQVTLFSAGVVQGRAEGLRQAWVAFAGEDQRGVGGLSNTGLGVAWRGTGVATCLPWRPLGWVGWGKGRMVDDRGLEGIGLKV